MVTLTFLAYFREVESGGDRVQKNRGPKRYNSDYRSLSEKGWVESRGLYVASLSMVVK